MNEVVKETAKGAQVKKAAGGEVVIRKAERGDKEKIYALNKSTGFLPRKEIFDNCLSNGDVFVYVAEWGTAREVVGFALYSINITLRKLTVDNLFVTPAFRRRNIGSRLLERVLTDANRNKIEYIYLYAQRANSFLKTNGFTDGENYTLFKYVL